MAHIENVEFAPQENHLILNGSRNNCMNQFKKINQFFFKDRVFNLISPPKLNILKECCGSHLEDSSNHKT